MPVTIADLETLTADVYRYALAYSWALDGGGDTWDLKREAIVIAEREGSGGAFDSLAIAVLRLEAARIEVRTVERDRERLREKFAALARERGETP